MRQQFNYKKFYSNGVKVYFLILPSPGYYFLLLATAPDNCVSLTTWVSMLMEPRGHNVGSLAGEEKLRSREASRSLRRCVFIGRQEQQKKTRKSSNPFPI